MFALSLRADAQALCSLRDPQKQIFRLFPEADSYRSIVRTVGKDARKSVSESLPFTLHFNELGRHTLYVAHKGSRPLGFVHVRTEAGRWGLVEVAWAFDLELRIVGFEFQRCRDRAKKDLERPAAREALLGLSFSGLRERLDADAKQLQKGKLPVPSSADGLAVTLIRNGLKTIAVTENVWSADVWRARAKAVAQGVDEEVAKVVSLAGLDEVGRRSAVANVVGEEGTGLQRDSLRAWECRDDDGAFLGRVLRGLWERDDVALDLYWFVDGDGVLRSVTHRGKCKEPEILDAFKAQVGTDGGDASPCGSPVELVTREVLLQLQRSHVKGAGGR